MIRDLHDDEIHQAIPLKWGSSAPGVIPAWVAEMDFKLAPPIEETLVAAIRRGTTGYPPRGDGGVGAAFAEFAQRHWGWAPPADTTVIVGDVVAAIELALTVIAPAGPVVVHLPAYPPFRQIVPLTGRETITVEVHPDAELASMELAGLERAFEAGGKVLILCNPHNPLGRVWTRDELEDLRDLTQKHNVRVITDEIHAPLVLPGAEFTSYLEVDPTAILVTSASKAFNTAGLHCASLITLDPGELNRLRSVPIPQNCLMSPLGILAAVSAYTDCDDWLASLVGRLNDQRRLLLQLLDAHLPKAQMRPLEASYLAWIDLREYGVADIAAAAVPAGVQPGAGQDYHPGVDGHVRLNIATSPARLITMIERLASVLNNEA